MRALITGATSGIGEAFAKKLAREKYDLWLTGRNQERLEVLKKTLEQAYNVKIDIFQVDFTKEEQVESFCKTILAKQQAIKIFINNAGVGHYGIFADQDEAQIKETIQVNISALTELTRRLYPCFKKGSRIMQVASTAAFAPGPYMSVYYASKAYVLALGLALREEWAKDKIGVSVLCPGPTATAFQQKAKMEKTALAKLFVATPEQVVEVSYKGLIRNQAVIIPGVSNKISAKVLECIPGTIGAKLVSQTQKK